MVIMKRHYITWAEENGCLTHYNKPVTSERAEMNLEYIKVGNLIAIIMLVVGFIFGYINTYTGIIIGLILFEGKLQLNKRKG